MNTTYSRSRYYSLILILGALTALGPFSIDMYLPGFPAIAADLNTTEAQVSLTLSSYFIGITAGQLLYGPLIDRFGRKNPLYIGLTAYILASAGCMYSNSIESLIALRFIQAVGSCAAGVVSIAMVRDLFPIEENAKIFSMLILVLGTSPLIAPTAGGYVTSAFGWHAVFFVLTLMGIALLAGCIFGLPESRKPDPSVSLKPKPILLGFAGVLREPRFLVYVLTGAIAFAALFAYVAGSPYVFMTIFKVSDKVYGWIFAFLSIGFIGASQLNRLFLLHFSSKQIVTAAIVCQTITGTVFTIAALSGWLGLYSTIAFLFVLLCCLGCINPNTSALAMAPFTKNAGSASALMGALQMGIGSLASVAISIFSNGTIVPLAAVMAGAAFVALLVLWSGQRSLTKKEKPAFGAGAS